MFECNHFEKRAEIAVKLVVVYFEIALQGLFFSKLKEEVLLTEDNIFHLKWRCQGQRFPAVRGHPGFEMRRCNQTNLKASDVLSLLPRDLINFPTPTMLDVARLISIWTSPGSISEKTLRILNPSYKTLSFTGLRCALSFFRAKCSHHAWLYKLCHDATTWRHPDLRDYPVSICYMFTESWRASQFDWNDRAIRNSELGVKTRVLVVVPHHFQLLKPMSTEDVFIYRTIREWNSAFAHQESVGAIVVVLPVVSQTFTHEFSTEFASVTVKWLESGKRVFVLPPPKARNASTWYSVCQEASRRIRDITARKPHCLHLIRQYLPAENSTESEREPYRVLGAFAINDLGFTFSEIQCRIIYGAWRRQLDDEVELPLLKGDKIR